MKKISLAVLMALSLPVYAESEDLGTHIQEIESEIAKIKKYQSEGVKSDIFDQELSMLETKKKEYEKLLRKEQKRARRESSKEISKVEAADKKFPTALKKDLAEFKAYQDESIPLEKRYDLILEELKNVYEIQGKLDSLAESQKSESITKLQNLNRSKIQELEGYKNKYEIMIRESENNELADMKKGGLRLGGMADIYYLWDFNRPKRAQMTANAQGGVYNNSPEIPYKNYTSRHNDFTINLLELNVYKSYKNLDFYADIDFGEQPNQNKNFNDDPVAHHLGQGFLRYKFANLNNLTFTAGKFYSHFGYETPKNIENRTYSRPFYYNLVCPFWHEGVSLTQSGIWDKLGYGLYIYDKSDDRTDNDQDKTYGVQLNFTHNKLYAVYNLITGSEQNDLGSKQDYNHNGDKRTQHELIISHNTTENLTFVVDALVGSHKRYDSATGEDAKWWGVVTYADVKTSSNNQLNFRYENFRDQTSSNAASTIFATNTNFDKPKLDSYTITNRYNLGNGSELRAEWRLDTSTRDMFPNSKGELQKTQNTLLVGWLYSI